MKGKKERRRKRRSRGKEKKMRRKKKVPQGNFDGLTVAALAQPINKFSVFYVSNSQGL